MITPSATSARRPDLAAALAVSLDVLDELLATLHDVPARHSDAQLLSLLTDASAVQIGMLMERFTALDIASRHEVLHELLILSGHPAATNSPLAGPSPDYCPVGLPGICG